MDTQQLERLSLEDGKSEALRQCFALMAEATAMDGGPRFDPKVCRDVARAIVCRTYAGPIHELCHLIILAGRLDGTGRHEGLFWGLDRVSPGGFRQAFSEAQASGLLGSGVELGPGEAVHIYADGRFAVTFGRMPFLAGLLEVLITLLEYPVLDGILDPLRSGQPDGSAVGDVANELSRAVYAVLKDHLPAVQAQRRNRAMISYLADQADGTLERNLLDDDFVLSYWRDASTGTDEVAADADARTFAGVFQAVLRLVQAVEAASARDDLASARPIGTDREAGEVEPAAVEALAAEMDTPGNLLDRFDTEPVSHIKFLNGRERDVAGDLLPGTGLGEKFPKSVLRAAVFGRAQSKITAARRRGLQDEELADTINGTADETYDDRLAAYQGLGSHLERLRQVAFHVLAGAERREAVALALELIPDVDTDALGIELDTGFFEPEVGSEVVNFGLARALRRIFDDLDAGQGPLAPLAETAAKEAKAVARQGFKPADLGDTQVIDGFAAALSPLKHLLGDVRSFLDGPGTAIDWAETYAEDHPVFMSQFHKIYGAAHA